MTDGSKLTKLILDLGNYEFFQGMYNKEVKRHKDTFNRLEGISQTRVQFIIDMKEYLGFEDGTYLILTGLYTPSTETIEFEGAYEGVEWCRKELSEEELANLKYPDFYETLLEDTKQMKEIYDFKIVLGDPVNLTKEELYARLKELPSNETLNGHGIYTDGALKIITNHQLYNTNGDYLKTVCVSAHFKWDDDKNEPKFGGWNILPPNNLFTVYLLD